MNREKRICPVCNEQFRPKTENHKYCSQKCSEWGNINTDYFSVFYRDNFRCQYCGKTPRDGIKLTIDHVYPLSEEGGEDNFNLVTACENCNNRKGETLWQEDKIKEVWWRNKKLVQREPKKSYKEMIEEFKKEYPDEPIPSPSSYLRKGEV